MKTACQASNRPSRRCTLHLIQGAPPSLDSSTEEYFRRLEAYPALGYEVCILLKTGVTERADFVLSMLKA